MVTWTTDAVGCEKKAGEDMDNIFELSPEISGDIEKKEVLRREIDKVQVVWRRDLKCAADE